jgi:hypothetical protein
MAAKINIMKMVQEMHGLAEVTNRRPAPRQPGLFLVQLRSHIHGPPQIKRKQTIAVDGMEGIDIPHPVKIRHVYGPLFPEVSVKAMAEA